MLFSPGQHRHYQAEVFSLQAGSPTTALKNVIGGMSALAIAAAVASWSESIIKLEGQNLYLSNNTRPSQHAQPLRPEVFLRQGPDH
jgi:hypothetical protein